MDRNHVGNENDGRLSVGVGRLNTNSASARGVSRASGGGGLSTNLFRRQVGGVSPSYNDFRQPPIWRRASVSLAWSLSRLVSLASFNSNMVRSSSAVSSASASACKRYGFFMVFGACLARMSCRSVAWARRTAGSLRVWRYVWFSVALSSASFLCTS